MEDSKYFISISTHKDSLSDNRSRTKELKEIPVDPSRAKQLSTDHTLREESWPRLMRKKNVLDGDSACRVREEMHPSIPNENRDKSALSDLGSFWQSLPLTLRKCAATSK